MLEKCPDVVAVYEQTGAVALKGETVRTEFEWGGVCVGVWGGNVGNSWLQRPAQDI